MKEDIAKMLDQIASQDYDSAAETFNSVVGDKVGAALENMKVDVANAHFNNMDEAVRIGVVNGSAVKRGADLPVTPQDRNEVAKRAKAAKKGSGIDSLRGSGLVATNAK